MVLFPSQSISGKEGGIEEFNSPKIEREMLGREGRGYKEREHVRQRCNVCVCEREKKGKTVRASDRLTWGK